MLSYTVAADIRKAISRGEFMPGEQISEIRATQRFDCSRNTLREAFALLETQLLVERIPNRGVFLATPTASYIYDLYVARTALEPVAIRSGTFDEDLLALAVSALAPSEHGDHQTVSTINQCFHRKIVAGLGSQTLDQLMDSLLARMRLTFLHAIPQYPSLHLDCVDANIGIAQRILAGEREQAAQEMHDYLDKSLNSILNTMSDREKRKP